jgi:SGNH hydrolase-like domain, acetyltransferase AlgX
MQSTLPVSSLIAPHAGGPTDPSHDEDLRRGILHTEVARPVAWLLVVGFVLAIFALPLSQIYLEKRADEESPLLDLFRRAPSAANLHQLEHDLEEAAYAKAFIQPRLQLLLSRFGRVGNKRAVVGRAGWLYYAPGVLHVAGPGFLDANLMRSREKAALDASEPAISADPRPAIFEFQRALLQRGIRLVVVPLPDKASIEPAPLLGNGAHEVRPDNPDFARFVAELRSHGVAVFDARAALPQAPAAPVYLRQDTHWTPAFMEQVAARLGRYVNDLGVLTPPANLLELHTVPQPATRVGDIVDMLKLPEDQTQFLPQTVTVHQVQDAQGNPWEADPHGDVLLLGDSFSNIFSLEGMGWGAAAGLGPQLSLALGRPLDVIAQNDSGAFATRQALARELAAGNDRLAGKRVVIWEFASRELSVGDWKHLDWPVPSAHAAEVAP